MRNLGGAVIAVICGSWLAIALQLGSIVDPAILFRLLEGATQLILIGQETPFQMLAMTLPAWLVMGAIAGVLAEPGWNDVRSSMWIGSLLALLTIASLLIDNPALWYATERNMVLFLVFVRSLLIAQLSLVSAVPVSYLLHLAKTQRALPPPEEIRTVCVCGAVFKSRPEICSQ